MTDNADLVGVDRWDRGWRGVRSKRKPSSGRYLTQRLLGVLEQYLGSKEKTILEVGCGGGAWMTLVARRLGCRVYGLDYSLAGCRLARQRLQQEALPQLVICSDAFCAPFRPHSFDAVYSLGVVEHFQNTEEIVRAMVSLLKPGGQLVVGAPNMNGLLGYLHRLADRDHWLRHVALTPQDIVRLFKMFDLDVQYAEYVGTLSLGGPNWARLLRSERLGSLARIVLAGLETLLTLPLRVLNLKLEHPYFSPYVLVVGRKSSDSSGRQDVADEQRNHCIRFGQV